MKKKLLSLALALAVCLGLSLPAFAADSDFDINDGVLIEYTGPGGDVVIPDGVTRIADEAFVDCTSLTSLTIPSSVTSIGDFAFAWCDSLTNVTIPSSVTSIGNYVFEECSSLEEVTIPSSVTSIGVQAFQSCSSLKEVTIPSSVTSIGDAAFSTCTSLTSVAIPKSVTDIGMYAFANCRSLTGVTIPEGVTSIKDQTFETCISLKEVTIPSSVTSIGEYAFSECENLTDVYYTGSEEQWKAVEIGEENDGLDNATIHYNSAGPQEPTETTKPSFTDVKTGDYFAEPVAWAVEKGVTAGTSATTFSPNADCTQGQILTFLWRAKGEPKPAGAVGGTEYYAAAAQWAKEQGLTDNFSAEADCTRAMVVTYLWKLAGSPKTGASDFTDVPANADYAQAVAWALEQGVTAGTSATTFSPDSVCTRGQIVCFLYRALAE